MSKERVEVFTLGSCKDCAEYNETIRRECSRSCMTLLWHDMDDEETLFETLGALSLCRQSGTVGDKFPFFVLTTSTGQKAHSGILGREELETILRY